MIRKSGRKKTGKKLAPLEPLSHSGERSRAWLVHSGNEIEVGFRESPLREGWEIKRFLNTPLGRRNALEAYERFKSEVR